MNYESKVKVVVKESLLKELIKDVRSSPREQSREHLDRRKEVS